MGAKPDTPTIRMNLAHAVAAAAAGTVAGVLGAAGLGAQETHVLDGAVAASKASQQYTLDGVFGQVHEQPAGHAVVQALAYHLKQGRRR